jgi:chromosome segregation ATPase
MDPLERIRQTLDEAERERDALRYAKANAADEIHQLKRRLNRAEEGYREVNDLNSKLKRQLGMSENRIEALQRALVEHQGRVPA